MKREQGSTPKHRIRGSILIGGGVGAVLLVLSFAPLLRHPEREFALTQTAWFCTRCGLQTSTRTGWLFGSRIMHSARLPFEPLLKETGETCNHTPERLGYRFFAFELQNLRTTRVSTGFPNGDPFYRTEALLAALRTIAQTNRPRAELLVKDIFRLRGAAADFGDLLPSLKSGTGTQCLAELLGPKFQGAAIFNTPDLR